MGQKIRSLKQTPYRLNCALAIFSSNTEAAISSFGTAITHSYSSYKVLFKGPDNRARLKVFLLPNNTENRYLYRDRGPKQLMHHCVITVKVY